MLLKWLLALRMMVRSRRHPWKSVEIIIPESIGEEDASNNHSRAEEQGSPSPRVLNHERIIEAISPSDAHN